MGYGFNSCQSAGNQGGNCKNYSGFGNTFALIVVLFILLIIVGTAFC